MQHHLCQWVASPTLFYRRLRERLLGHAHNAVGKKLCRVGVDRIVTSILAVSRVQLERPPMTWAQYPVLASCALLHVTELKLPSLVRLKYQEKHLVFGNVLLYIPLICLSHTHFLPLLVHLLIFQFMDPSFAPLFLVSFLAYLSPPLLSSHTCSLSFFFLFLFLFLFLPMHIPLSVYLSLSLPPSDLSPPLPWNHPSISLSATESPSPSPSYSPSASSSHLVRAYSITSKHLSAAQREYSHLLRPDLNLDPPVRKTALPLALDMPTLYRVHHCPIVC